MSSVRMVQDGGEVLYGYRFMQCSLTVDIVVQSNEADPRVLLIQRKHNPYVGAWALPGGFVDICRAETPHGAALRELQEETGVDGIELTECFAVAGPDRDPRGYSCSFIFTANIDIDTVRVQAGDDAAVCQWFPVDTLPRLAFDHASILARVLGVNTF